MNERVMAWNGRRWVERNDAQEGLAVAKEEYADTAESGETYDLEL